MFSTIGAIWWATVVRRWISASRVVVVRIAPAEQPDTEVSPWTESSMTGRTQW